MTYQLILFRFLNTIETNKCNRRSFLFLFFIDLKKRRACFPEGFSLYWSIDLLDFNLMLDTITITVQSGKGGDGCVSARREAGVPF